MTVVVGQPGPDQYIPPFDVCEPQRIIQPGMVILGPEDDPGLDPLRVTHCENSPLDVIGCVGEVALDPLPQAGAYGQPVTSR